MGSTWKIRQYKLIKYLASSDPPNSMRIDRIEINKGENTKCHRCMGFIKKWEFKLMGSYYDYHLKQYIKGAYCMNCGPNLEIDKLDMKRLELQLEQNRLNW